VTKLPWLNYLLVNAPDPYFGGFSWFDFEGNPEPGIVRSRKMLFQLLDDLRSRGFPSDKSIVGGFSQGGLMAWEAGLYYPHRFAGLIGISGYVHEPEELLRELSPVARKQRMLFTHGTQDPLIPFGKVRQQVDALKAAGLNIEWREFVKAHTIAGDEELDVIRGFIAGRFTSL